MSRILPLLTTVLVVLACDDGSGPDREVPPDTEIIEVNDGLQVTTVARDLQAPWEVAFAADRVFVTERDTGRVIELVDGQPVEIRHFDVNRAHEGGLLGLAPSPQFDDDRSLYAYMTTDEDNRVIRFSVDDPDNAQVILSGIPSAAIHNGGRIAFGPDGHLWIATGDAGEPNLSQDPDSLAGKILRITADGEVPQDNPFDDSPVWALGLRNVQGLAWDGDGQLYATEFGPDVDDEVNRIVAGQNYGWPDVTGRADQPSYADPLFVRQPPEASWSGATFLVDGSIDAWEGNLFVAALRGNRLWRLELSDDGQQVVDTEQLLTQWGRLRQAVQAPDGSLWVLTNNRDGRGNPAEGDDRILRIGP